MEAFDGLVKFYPEYALHLRNESFLTGHPLDRFPTTENILKGTLIDSNDGSGILPYPSILNLYGNGCRSYPTNEINCTAVCADERDLFVDWQTQWNCLTLSNMAINKPYPHNYNNSNNAGDTARILNQLGVTNLTAFDSIGVLKRYIACANETWFPSWDSYLPEWEALVETSQHLNLHELGVAFSHICDEGIFQISSDIAGPGILCSYMMSFAIVLYAWICFRILHIASSIDWFARLTRYQAEMQEAQCFFSFAVQVGLMTINIHGPDGLGSSLWRDFILNRSLMKALTNIATFPILLNQILLYKLHLDSFYSLSLCTVVMAMSYATYAVSFIRGISPSTMYLTSMTIEYGACGSGPDLRSLCSFGQIEDTGLHHSRALMDMCLATLIIIWARKLWREFAGTLWLRNYAQNNSKMRATGLAYMIQFGLLLTSIFIFIVEIISIVFIAINLLPLYGLWMYMYSGSFRHSGNDTWSISQIISVLVWAPVLSRYFYLLVFGVERGFAIRLSKAFAVIRKQKQPTGLEDQTDKDGHPNFRSTTAEIAV